MGKLDYIGARIVITLEPDGLIALLEAAERSGSREGHRDGGERTRERPLDEAGDEREPDLA